MEPVVVSIIVAVLGVATGVFASHATLGNKVTRALTILEGVDARLVNLEQLERSRMHHHRRKSDPLEGS